MKKSMKAEMIKLVEEASTKVDEEKNIYYVSELKIGKLEQEIAELEKFLVINNKKDDTLRAVVYKTKKSNILVKIKIVKENTIKVGSENKVNCTFTFKFKMEKDAGMDSHIARFEMKADSEVVFEEFLKLINKNILTSKIGDLANYVDVKKVEDKYEGYIIFPKVKGMSKEAYSNYKKCVTDAKREMKKAE